MVNTVNFSNHSGGYAYFIYDNISTDVGYHRFGGSKTTVEELNDIFTALRLNELLMPTRVLTGYIPTGEALRAVGDIVLQLKQTTPDIIYLLDRMSNSF